MSLFEVHSAAREGTANALIPAKAMRMAILLMIELRKRTCSVGYGDEGPGMQPGRTEASPINPKKLVSNSPRALCKNVPLSPCRIVTVAVKPDTSGTPGGTLSIAIRTGTRCAKRTQV